MSNDEYKEVAGSLEERANETVEKKTAAVRQKMTRVEAVAVGERLGTHEAWLRGEIGSTRDQRIARAKAYAAWEYDGRPPSSAAQRKEFGVADSEVTPSLERPPLAAVKDKK